MTRENQRAAERIINPVRTSLSSVQFGDLLLRIAKELDARDYPNQRPGEEHDCAYCKIEIRPEQGCGWIQGKTDFGWKHYLCWWAEARQLAHRLANGTATPEDIEYAKRMNF